MTQPRWIVLAAVAAAVVTLGVAALLTTIIERKQEARNPFYRVVELTDTTVDPSVWGRNFPQQYDDYRKTVDMVHTRYGGSEATPRTPTAIDPRQVVAQSRLEEDPRLMQMWAGYAFAQDFREERGHAYMLSDQVFTERQRVTTQPGTCLHCHASMYVAYKRAGGGDLIKGFEKLNPMPYFEAKKLAGDHPVSCIDCHDAETMALRVTRPGFLEGIRALPGIAGGQPTTTSTDDASRQEMRTYVCGQCHVEYYFKGDQKRLTYPWAQRPQVDSIFAYYEANGHKDWTHARSGAPVLKAQHPEFEMCNQGIHARSGRGLCGLPHALPARGRPQDQRPPRAQPAAQHQPGLPDLPQDLGERAGRAGLRHPGPHLRDPEHGHRRPARPDRRNRARPRRRQRQPGGAKGPAVPARAPSSMPISSRPKTRWASMPTRRRSVSWPTRSTFRGWVRRR